MNLPNAHRLLYRGALSLPDSHILLDGLSFTAALTASGNIASSVRGEPVDLLNYPLALALESMRGRPSLHLLGTVKLEKLWIDETSVGAIQLDIHPQATLSRLYFENIFCLVPITASDGRSEYGVRVSLSDSDDPCTSDIVIYAQLHPPDANLSDNRFDVPSASTVQPRILRLLAARILPGQPPPLAPPRPRPDGPTPRVPPTTFALDNVKRKGDKSLSVGDMKSRLGDRAKEREKDDATETLRKARETMMRLPKPGTSFASGKASGRERKTSEFKVPEVPQHAGSASREKRTGHDPDRTTDVIVQQIDETPTLPPDEREKANKTIIKQAVVRCLADHSVSKQHHEFNDIFQYVYRGTCFAMRASMRTAPVDLWNVYKLVDAHAKMYVHSDGRSE